jgi:hypothetical protein
VQVAGHGYEPAVRRAASSWESVVQEADAASEYTAHLQVPAQSGALLIYVVGAKLSEGTNPGDGWRCVALASLNRPSKP